jgi:glycosyltransferase involved in cell wall biosynthesis
MYQPVISIVIPVRNEGDRIVKTINTFAFGRSTLFHLEFVIIDDASDDECCTSLEDLLTWEYDAAVVRVIRLEQWSGIPYARNIGAVYAQAPILFITDANVEACQNWDIPLFRDLRPGKVLGAAIADNASSWVGYGCALLLPSMGVSWLSNPYEFEGNIPVCVCTGTVIYTELFKKAGGYDTAMPVYGAAEPEFSVRLWLYGAEITICPDLILSHRFRPAEEREEFLEKIEFTQTMNYLHFGLLYLDEKKTVDLFDYWARARPAIFSSALQQVKAGKVWERRTHLQERLSHDFNWYVNRFDLRSN